MRWAFVRGTSTARSLSPRGIGLDLLKDFIRKNGGQLEIYSHDGYARIDAAAENYQNLPVYFEGTLAQARLHCDDKYYALSNELSSEPYF
jgi:uncharacterized membrane protein